ncbi:MAG: XisI protein [Thermosynechococcaceae cyanobacterium]
MVGVNEYPQIVQDYLKDFAQSGPNAQLIFDCERDSYLVCRNGWRKDYRIYGCAMHLDIIEGQVWIQHNSTEIYIERELMRRGVSPQDIVFGFRAPSIRDRLTAALKL